MNVPLMRKVLERIEANPDGWSQLYFGINWDHAFDGERLELKQYEPDREPCGTTFCIAGHTAVMYGYTLDNDNQWHSPNGKRTTLYDIENFAQAKLDLPDIGLFYEMVTDVVELRSILEEMAGEKL